LHRNTKTKLLLSVCVSDLLSVTDDNRIVCVIDNFACRWISRGAFSNIPLIIT